MNTPPPPTTAAYVINLDRHSDRLFEFYRQPDTHYFRRVAAVDKQVLALLGTTDFCFDTAFIRDHIDREATFGEVGCTLSHIKTWQLIAENADLAENDFALIAEDDVRLINGFSYHLTKLLPAFRAMSADLIVLQRIYINENSERLYQGGEFALAAPQSYLDCDDGGSSLYLIRKSKAAELVRKLNSEKPHWLADEFSLFCPLDKMFIAQKALGYVPSNSVSDLEQERIIARRQAA
ncbi:MAG: glycosyltransferase family 25 protein [Neisseria sp.]|nr:glycosyltransferase family 25 protein [Neisseria sp.]